jgi:hypothetical protein
MLSPESQRLIQASSGWRMHRIEMFDLPHEGRVVVKGQRPARGPWRFRVLRALAACVQSPLVAPVPSPGGHLAQATEARRLRALAQAGVRVPELLHQADDHLVLRRLDGEPLEKHFERDPAEALSAFVCGLQGLAHVHARHQYLSQGFARNMLLSQGHLWFIDFEDDPLQAMSLPDAQARDILSYLLSAIWCNRAARPDLMAAWRAWVPTGAPEVMCRVRKASGRLAWLRHLPRQRKPWGRDTVTVQALADFLHHWNTSDPAL